MAGLRRSMGSYPVLSILRATRGFSSKPPPLSVAMANAQKMIGTKRDDELVHKRMVSKLQEEVRRLTLLAHDLSTDWVSWRDRVIQAR